MARKINISGKEVHFLIDEQKILEAIESLRRDLGGKFDDIERRLNSSEEQQKRLTIRQNKSERCIKELFARLDALCEDKLIWVSKDRREVGVQKEDAYATFKKMGFSRLEAMHLLDKAGRLSRNTGDKHLTKMVRSPEIGKTRAVVIFMEDG